MAAHRFWRLHIYRNGGDTNYASIADLVLAETPGGVQGAVGGTASASNERIPAEGAKNAFDGLSGTFWRGFHNGGAAFIQYDMGSGRAIDVAEIRITFGSGVGASSYPRDFTLLYSDDGVGWTAQAGWSDAAFVIGVEQAFGATPIPANLRFNRILERIFRRSLSANAGPPTLFTTMPNGVLGGGIRHHTAPRAAFPHSGAYFIQGTTTALGEPLARRVDLYEQKSGLLARKTFSKEDGAFRFDYIGPGPWTVVGVDQSAEQNSVIFAHVIASPMT